MRESQRKTSFKELEHTADLRVEIWGKDEADLFRNAVESLYVILGIPGGSIRGGNPPLERLEIQGQDSEEALVELLGDLLYMATVERARLEVRELTVGKGEEGAAGCRVVVSGFRNRLSDKEMARQREIKAVTYHDVWIRRTDQGFSARVVMDL